MRLQEVKNRIDSAMQQSGSLNQPPLRFVVDTLTLDVNFEKQNKSMLS